MAVQKSNLPRTSITRVAELLPDTEVGWTIKLRLVPHEIIVDLLSDHGGGESAAPYLMNGLIVILPLSEVSGS